MIHCYSVCLSILKSTQPAVIRINRYLWFPEDDSWHWFDLTSTDTTNKSNFPIVQLFYLYSFIYSFKISLKLHVIIHDPKIINPNEATEPLPFNLAICQNAICYTYNKKYQIWSDQNRAFMLIRGQTINILALILYQRQAKICLREWHWICWGQYCSSVNEPYCFEWTPCPFLYHPLDKHLTYLVLQQARLSTVWHYVYCSFLWRLTSLLCVLWSLVMPPLTLSGFYMQSIHNQISCRSCFSLLLPFSAF